MRPIETVVRSEYSDVRDRLVQMDLDLDALHRVLTIARGAAANATPFHCRNAAGTFSYQHGTWALRAEFVGPDWAVERPEGVEAIWNSRRGVRVVFSNVDIACADEHQPKPRSEKGAGAERVCEGNLFGYLPHYAPQPSDSDATFYLMMDEEGRAELSRPVVVNKTFAGYLERIYIRLGDDDELLAPLGIDDDDALNDFDPQVARK